MEPIRLTKENKDILREYYINLYIIKLKDQEIYDDSMYEEIVAAVDYMIQRYEKHGNIKASFPKFMTNYNRIYEKNKSRLVLTNEKVDLIKKGNLKYLETLIDYYKNMLKLNVGLMYLKEPFDNKDEILKEGLVLIDTIIRNYFESKSNKNFTIYMSSRLQNFYFKHNLKGENTERSIIIDNKNGKTDEREKLYDKYYHMSIKRIKNTTNLPEEKFNLLIRTLVKNKIDSYFEGKEKNSTLRNYFEQLFARINEASEQIIVKYNLLFDDFYDESVSFIDFSIKEYISTYIRENDINKVSLIYRLTSKCNELARSYLNLCIENKRYIPFKPWLGKNIKELLKKKRHVSCFDMDLIINGEDEDKKEQLETLREELAYLKDQAKEKYVYYTDKDSVDSKIDIYYNNIMDSYANNIITKQSFPKRIPSRYISTRLFKNAKNFSVSTKREFEREKIGQMLCEQYRKVVVNYVKENDLSGDEKTVFLEYMNAVFRNYIKKGSYCIDIRLYLKPFIDSYDYEFAKNVIAIKDFEELGVKVLRRPVIK